MSKIIERLPIKGFFQHNTVKLLRSPSNAFLGTGFFVAPDKIATCFHNLFANNKAVTSHFSIAGYPGTFALEGHTNFYPGLDLLIIQLDFPVTPYCINLESGRNKEGDRLWGWSFNTNYPDGAGLIPVLQEAADHNKWKILRVSRDIVKQGSSGTPILNVDSGKLLGVTYWAKEDDAFIIPAQYFESYFPELFEENQRQQKSNPFWIETQNLKHNEYLTPIPPISNKNVIGRTIDLYKLRESLCQSHNAIVINGIGGIGKTTLAKLYLHNYVEEYDRLIWLEQKDDFVKDVSSSNALIQSLQLGHLTTNPSDLFQRIMLTLQNYHNGLNILVIDNATRNLLHYLDNLPHGPYWHVLLTSREAMGDFFETINLGTLDPKAAQELFYNHCHEPQDSDALTYFLAQLEYHTLSIELFAKILENHYEIKTVNELSEYLKLKQIDEIDLQIDIDIQGTTQLYKHLLKAFDLSGLSFRPELILILQRMAALPPSTEGYARKDLIEWFGMKNNPTDSIDCANQISELFRLGWLSQMVKNSFSLHRLISLIVSKVYPVGVEELSPMVDVFISKLSFDPIKDNPKDKFIWIPFGQALLDALENLEWEQKNILQNKLALILIDSKDYTNAKILLEKAISSAKNNLGVDHPTTMLGYSNLSLVLKDQGDYQGAKILLEKVRTFNEQHYGIDHPNTAESYSNLATIFQILMHYDEALDLQEKTVLSAKKFFGVMHPKTAVSYSNLARAYTLLNRPKEAHIFFTKAFNIFNSILGADHPYTQNAASNIQSFTDFENDNP